MKRWVILGGADIKDYSLIKSRIGFDDFIVSVDGGMRHLKPLGVKSNLYLGDFDSAERPDTDCEVLTYPVEKDDTDTMLAIKIGIKRGCKEFIIFGGMGGRFDHTVANLQALLYAQRHGANAALADENNLMFLLKNDTAHIHPNQGEKVSVFAFTEPCHGITLEGFYYPLKNGTLYPFNPMGVSNHIVNDTGKITVKKGTLLIVISKENQ